MSPSLSLSEDQRDCLQEIVNVAMGQAGESLAQMLGQFVDLSIPKICLVERDGIRDALSELVEGDVVSATRQGFDGDRIHGDAITLYSQSCSSQLQSLLKQQGFEHSEVEGILKVSSILNEGIITGVGSQIEAVLTGGEVKLIAEAKPLEELLKQDDIPWEQALLVKINYGLEGLAAGCDLILLMPEPVIIALRNKLDELLEDL